MMPKKLDGQVKNRKTSVLALIIGGVIFYGLVLFALKNQVPSDIVSPYMAGWFFGHGQYENIYGYGAKTMFDNTPPKAWLSVITAQDAEIKTLYPYLYPPIWAAMLAPITRILDINAFSWLFYILQIPMIYASIYLGWRIFGQRGGFFIWAAAVIFLGIVSVIGLSAIAENQPQILVVFLIIFGIERWSKGRAHVAGFLFALAATIKIFPVLILFLIVARKDWRTASFMIFWGCAIVLASFAIAGAELHFQYLDQLQMISKNIYLGQHNLSLSGLLSQINTVLAGGPAQSIRFGLVSPSVGWISLVNFLVFAGGLLAISLKFAQNKNMNLIIALLLFAGLTSPFGWSYYYLPLVFFWPVIFLHLSRNRAIFATYLVWTPLLSFFQSVVRGNGFYNFAQIAATMAIILATCLFLWVGWRKNPAFTLGVD